MKRLLQNRVNRIPINATIYDTRAFKHAQRASTKSIVNFSMGFSWRDESDGVCRLREGEVYHKKKNKNKKKTIIIESIWNMLRNLDNVRQIALKAAIIKN